MNSKSKLNIYCQKTRKPIPCYTTEKKGEQFVSTVTINETSYHSINGHSTKKEAENDAAGVAIQSIVQNHPSNKSIDELIDQLPATKNKKKSKQQKPDTQHQPGPEFTTVSAAIQPPVSVPGPIRPQQHVGVPAFQRYQSMPPPARPYMQPDSSKQQITNPQQLGPEFIPISQAYRPIRPMQPLRNESPSRYYRPEQSMSPPVHQPPPSFTNRPYIMQQSYPPMQPPPHPLLNAQIPIIPSRPMMVAQQSPVRVLNPRIPSSMQPPASIHSMSPVSAAGYGNGLQGRGSLTSQTSRPIMGKPLTAIPSPNRPLFGPYSSPVNVQPQVTSSNTVVNSNVVGVQEDHSTSLEDHCKKHGLPDAIYSVREKGGKFTARVEIGNRKFCTDKDFSSFEEAKENVTLTALVTLGIQEFRIGSPSLPTQEASARAADSSSDVTLESPVSKLYPKTSLQEESPPPLETGGSSALKPPSFFQPSTESLTPSQQTVPTNSRTPTCIPDPNTSVSAKPKGMEGNVNHKSTLNTYCQKNKLNLTYDCSYPDDAVGYIATVEVGSMKFTSAPHGTKRAAEDQAAEQAVKYLGAYREMNKMVQPTPVSSSSPVHTATSSNISYKNLLQEHCHKTKVALPHYETERTEDGFKSTVRVHQASGPPLEFTSSAQIVKKGAEQEAAKLACEALNIE